ncbi:hypothetical protein H8356DRAFT_1331018 [Neocallimastix lanati (nom. inval.)]|nr:hypothetical protein H8356DRAFT_1331018 [Neocallimastix sp. JGI-2020a]
MVIFSIQEINSSNYYVSSYLKNKFEDFINSIYGIPELKCIHSKDFINTFSKLNDNHSKNSYIKRKITIEMMKNYQKFQKYPEYILYKSENDKTIYFLDCIEIEIEDFEDMEE